MSSDIGERIRLLREKKNLTQAELGKDFNISDAGVSFWEVNGVKQKQLLKKIADYFGVSLEYLKEGKQDNPTKTKKDDTGLPKVITVDTQGNENIVYIPVKARAGYLVGYGDPEFISELPVYRLPGFNNATYRMFEVEGKSMSPTINNRDIVIGEWVERLEDIRDERVYVVVSKNDGIVIKRLLNRIKQHGGIIAKSDNHDKLEYENLFIAPEDVKELWYARAYMSNYFTAPSDLYNRISNLEVDVDILKRQLKTNLK